jgi:hypothetical protein
LNATVLKTVVRVTPAPRVRIPAPPLWGTTRFVLGLAALPGRPRRVCGHLKEVEGIAVRALPVFACASAGNPCVDRLNGYNGDAQNTEDSWLMRLPPI